MAHPPPPIPPHQQTDRIDGADAKPDVAGDSAAEGSASGRASQGETANRAQNLTPQQSTQDR